MRHDLKCWPEFFDAILSGAKTFDLRNNDRNFGVGDSILLHEYDPQLQRYTDRFLERRVTYILGHRPDAGCAATHGLREGYVILGIAE